MLAYAHPSPNLASSEAGWFFRAAGATRSLSALPRPFSLLAISSMAQGIFVGLPESDLLAIRDAAVTDIKAGRVVTSYSAGDGSSVTKSYAMPPKEMLSESLYALRQLDPSTYGSSVKIIRTDYRTFDGF